MKIGNNVYPPVVVIGLGITGLGIVRSLSHKSLPVNLSIIGIDSDLSQPAASTRLCSKYYIDDLACGNTLTEKLIGLSQSLHDKPVLFLSKDVTVLSVLENIEKLDSYYRILLPDKEITELLMDKTRFANYAEQNGFIIPKTIIVQREEGLLKASEDIRYPCVMKPCYRNDEWQKKGYPKGFFVGTQAKLIEIYERVHSVQQSFVVQEWVDGPDSELYFCLVFFDENSQCRGCFTGRKLRQWPGSIGNTSLSEPIHCPEIEKETLRLFESLRFRGFGSVEFKRDSIDGRYKIMEPTVGRENLQSGVATANGVNLAWIGYSHLSGMGSVRSEKATRPVRWINEYADLRSSFVRIRDGQLSVRDWIRSYSGKKYFALFSWLDPMPFLLTFWKAGWHQLRKIASRILFKGGKINSDGDFS